MNCHVQLCFKGGKAFALSSQHLTPKVLKRATDMRFDANGVLGSTQWASGDLWEDSRHLGMAGQRAPKCPFSMRSRKARVTSAMCRTPQPRDWGS